LRVLIVFIWLPAYALFIAGLQWRVLPGAPWYLGAALLFFAMIMATRVEQPRATAQTSNTIPPEPTQSASSVV
jgi:hypothetical protein